MLTNLIMVEEIEVINTIPISHTNQPDVQIWLGNNSSIFFSQKCLSFGNRVGRKESPRMIKIGEGEHLVEDTLAFTHTKWSKNFLLASMSQCAPNKRQCA